MKKNATPELRQGTSISATHQNMRNADKVYKRQQQRAAERMRDTSHDNRLMINRDTPVGVDLSRRELNVRTTRGQ
ncbi:hypothetical protein [Bradyrhizobium sp. AUGA SZCCT0283]|uniref:hypothetical protein n=1 Tax=Bradyrhizobium sp. AUGA SZCCT0283 TaxID=2807671 RepID=UPI001BA83C9C|nr:hypothetical protein [Bradyrhizobium sp. AUGA SZCCT0283]MBR1275616.1 hypothetical protein [Bradyrhizobium sp. AUGA SZCCT0283]